eukprot:TRINITY_DN859_c0_g1_i1.p1 TRINITY_DN859_c0_g1~~TRINITY_DN859_c0_g1_i1.p1  ORF type:complete len:369 (+),score=121.91 TRINITY_DN859_c0_g1_i1:121-1227(+)
MSEEECKCTVYGVTPSYFTMKLVAAFEWTAVPFELKHKTLENKEWLEARSGTQQVPVLLVRPERWVLNDTTPILHWLDALQRTYHPQHAIAFYPPGMKGALVATLEEFFDEWVTRAALHFRWNYPESAAFAQRRMGSEMAGDGAGAADTAEMVGNMIERWGHMATKAVGLSEPTMQKALEEQFHRLLHRLDVLLAQKGRRFIFGPQPTALDAVVIGGMRAHFLNDPTPTAMLQKYAHIKRYVKESAEFNAARIERAKAEVVEGSEQLREFVLEVLHQMSTCGYGAYLRANRSGLEHKSKKVEVFFEEHDEVAAMYTRPYPEQSRRMLVRFLCAHIGGTDDAEHWNGMMREFALEDLFGVAHSEVSSCL